MKTIEDAYDDFLATRNWEANSFWLDPICMYLYEDYFRGAPGFAQRQKLRDARPTIYQDLEQVSCLEDFEAIVAQFKMEGVR